MSKATHDFPLLIPDLVHNEILNDKNGRIVDCGGPQGAVYIPVELCTVTPGQSSQRQLGPDHVATMITVACNRPKDNARLIVCEGLPLVGIGQAGKSPVVSPFSLHFED